MNKEAKSAHCIAPDRNNKQCRNYNLQDSRFCTFHQYMNEYTEDMMKCLTQCKTCLHHFYIPGFETCEKDRKRGIENRKEKRKKVILCKYYNEKDKKQCNFKKSDKNDYCGKHQSYYKTLEIEKDGTKKVCINYGKRYKCESVLDKNDKYSKCEKCRDIDCKKEKERNINKLNHKTDNISEGMQKCGKAKCELIYKITDFIDKDGKKLTTCPHCREIAKTADDKRTDRHKNPKRKYDDYKKRAKNKLHLDFLITYDEFKEYISKKCDYCNIDPNPYNGIDRIDNTKGYIKDNLVTCCTMCNMFKSDITLDNFMKIIEHILSVYSLIESEKYHKECFKFGQNITYKKYNSGADKRDYEFKLTEDEFNKILNNKCYMCNNNSPNNKSCGIDRIDNNIGYNTKNCLACCSTCNRLKLDYNIYDVISKLYDIYCNKNKINKKVTNDMIVFRIDKHLEKIREEYKN